MDSTCSQDSYASLTDKARACLERADVSWNTLQGRLHTFRSEDVLDVGRLQIRDSNQLFAPGSERELELDKLDLEETIHTGLDRAEVEEDRFFAYRHPWKLRIERVLQSTYSESVFDPDVLVLHRKRWWSLTGNKLEKGAIRPDKIIRGKNGDRRMMCYDDEAEDYIEDTYFDINGKNLTLLLKPVTLSRGLQISDGSPAIFDGRPAIKLLATPVEDLDRFLRFSGYLAVVGASAYVIVADAALGIVLAWAAYVSGELAAGQTLSQIRVDEPLDPNLFEIE